jgi:eukaryotic-like serine/threonine-protein kinase
MGEPFLLWFLDMSDSSTPSVNPLAFAETASVEQTPEGDALGDVPEGELVGGYVVEHKLGVGGFGTVYSAREPSIGRLVAIKVLSSAMSRHPELMARFLDEARAATKVRHRNIIDVFQFGQLKDGRPFQIMELLEGETLAQYLTRNGALPLEQALPLFQSLGRALDVVHDAEIIHRDVKPDNVFLTFDEEGRCLPKLLDFGIARLTTTGNMRKTQTGVPMGTPLYMSPEQCRGAGVGKASDIYSFGILMYECLVGAPPFSAATFIDLMNSHLTETPRAPSLVSPSVPQELDAVFQRVLAKEADQRPSRASDAVKLLEEAAISSGMPLRLGDSSPQLQVRRISHLGAAAVKVGGLSRSTPKPKRRKFWLALVPLCLLMLPVAWYLRPTPEPLPAPPNVVPVVISKPVVEPEPVAKAPIEPVAPPAKGTVHIRLSTNAPKAVVYSEGAMVGQAGTAMTRPMDDTPIRFQLKAPGFVDAEVVVPPLSDIELTVPMVKQKKKIKVPAALENPYGN